MANYFGFVRSNDFAVNDRQAFERALEGTDISVERSDNGAHAGKVTLISHDEVGWPTSVYDRDGDEDREFDLRRVLAEHVADEEVAVCIEIGYEKMRYLVGVARAVNNECATRRVSLEDICQATNELGANGTEAAGETP
jgi:hypothetical protein